MRFMKKAVAAGAILVAAMGGAVVSPTSASAAVTAPPPDGHLYAWLDINAGEYYHCRWVGNDDNWTNCTDWDGVARNMHDRASSVQNRGYTKEVNLYNDAGQRGAWRCLSRGEFWPDLRNVRFNRGSSETGYNYPMENRISSHLWVSSC
ncbi:hypothetical protein GCM10029976_094980 [Kribbella albertanoniae]|uniref:Peptidase inhibitor family I36 n=1 Tax=Kribbella albertanoniae TaxID=1266829 RepID=A0A4R4QF47_9ACTN|nr:peptidase inhibitor family I36 protein [Kribbella albertanoniae]TDC34148.1 hypothetical protein E1261_04295 [Kribbella albertanoniae]